MKFNKAKLAALATSVFMGVAMLATAAFAESNTSEVAPGTADPSQEHIEDNKGTEAETTYGSQDILEVRFHENGSVDVKFSKSGWRNGYTQATDRDVIQKQTCTDAQIEIMTVKINDKTWTSDPITTAKALGHLRSETELENIKVEATHDHPEGIKEIGYQCVRDCCTKDDKGNKKIVWLDKDAKEAAPREVKYDVAHEWVFDHLEQYVDENGKKDERVIIADGQAKLADPTKGGYYYKVMKCLVGGELDYIKETLEPTEGIALEPEIISNNIEIQYSENILGYYVAKDDKVVDFTVAALNAEGVNYPYDSSKIVLKDCHKAGKYTVVYKATKTNAAGETVEFYLDANGKQITNLTEAAVTPVPAQHVLSGKLRIANASENLSYKAYDKAGNYISKEDKTTPIYKVEFFNDSCLKEGNYKLDYECVGGTNDKTKRSWIAGSVVKVAPNPEAHRLPENYGSAEAQAALENLKKVDAEIKLLNITEPKAKMAVVDKYLNALKGYGVKHTGTKAEIENITSKCLEDGTADLVWYCAVCGAKLKTETIFWPALGHDYGFIREDVKEASCKEDGSYIAVEYCKREGCDYRHEEKVTIKHESIPHTFEGPKVFWNGTVVIDNPTKKFYSLTGDAKKNLPYVGTKETDDVNASEDFIVTANAGKICSVCGAKEEPLADATLEIVGNIVPSDKDGNPGSISLKASYTKDGKVVVEDTKTFPYYNSVNTYTSNRVVIDPSKDPDPETPADPEKPEVPEQLPAVENLKAATAGMNKITLTWDAVEGANGYLILKNGTQIAYTTGATTYTDKNASSENFEFYWVIPFQKVDGKNYKGQLSNYVWGIGRVVGQVQKVTATGAEGAVELSWNAVSGANGYVILSKTGSNTAPFNAAVETTETSATVKAEAGKVQFYWVYATYTNADGNKVAAGKCSPFAWAIAE